MDRLTKINEKGAGISGGQETEIIGIIKTALQQHKNFLGEVCNYIANVLSQKYEGWWCCFVVEKDALYGSRFFHFDNMYLDITMEGRRFTIFKSSQ